MKEGIWLTMSDGTVEYVLYEDLDSEATKKLLRPIGGFCYPATDFCILPLPNPPFFINGWLPVSGRMLVYAPSKSGKSWLAAQIARCVATGTPLFGTIPTHKARTLLIQCELSPTTFQKRLSCHTAKHKDYSNLYLGTALDLKIDSDDGHERLERALSTIQPEVLVIDPLYKATSVDENDTREMKTVVDYLDYLLDVYRISVVLIHHAGKDLSKGGRGSSVLEGYPDTVLELRRTSKLTEPLEVRLTPKLLRHAMSDVEFYKLRLMDDLKEFMPIKEESKEKPTTIKDKLREYLEDRPEPVQVKNLVTAGFGSRRGIIDALDALQDEGVVVKLERGLYLWNSGA